MNGRMETRWIVLFGWLGLVGSVFGVGSVPNFAASSSSRVAMATNLYSELTNLTLSAWIKTATRPASGNYSAIAGRGYLYSTTGFGLFLSGDDGKIYFQTRTGGTIVSAGAVYPFDGVWHHVAGVRDGNATRLYLDGKRVNEATGALSSLYSSGIAFGLGARDAGGSWGWYYTGAMAEVRLWNCARTESELQSDLFQRLTGAEAGLAGYWPLNEGDGNSISDRTSAGNGGVCSSVAWSADPSFGDMLSATNTYVGYWPLALKLADCDTRDTRLTDSNTVAVTGLSVPEGYTHFQIGTSAVASAVSPDGWLATNALPDSLTFTSAPGRVSFYAWFTNTSAQVPLRRSVSTMACFPVEAALTFRDSLYVNMGTNLFQGVTNLTLSVWVKTVAKPAAGNFNAIAGRGYLYGLNGFGLYLSGDDGKVYFQTRTGGTIVQTGVAYPFDGVWHHVAGVREGNVTRLYLDGALVAEATGSLSSLYSSGVAFGLGARDSGSGNWGCFFDGTLAEVQLWNCARATTDIRSDMFRCLEGTETGLVGYWPLTEGRGAIVTDRSDAGQDGACSAAPYWRTDVNTVRKLPVSRSPQFQGAWPFTMSDFDTGSTRLTDSNTVKIAAFPVPDGCSVYQLGEGNKSASVDPVSWTSTGAVPDRLSFPKPADGTAVWRYAWFTNTTASVALRRSAAMIIEECASNEFVLAFNAASNSHVAMATGLYSGLTNLTLSVWIKTSTKPSSGNYAAIAGRGFLCGQRGFGLFLAGDGKLYFQTTGDTGIQAGAAYSFDGAWHHVAGVRDGNATRLYLDGELVAEETASLSLLYLSGFAFSLGARHAGVYGWAFYFTGSMRDVRLYNYARSAHEIKTDRSYYLKGTETGLVGYWPLDEGADDAVFDGTKTNDNHGTVFDAFWEHTVDFMRQRPPPGLLIRAF